MLGHRGMAIHDFRGSSPAWLRSQVPAILIRLRCGSSVCGDGHDAVRAKIHYAYLISGPRFRPNLLPPAFGRRLNHHNSSMSPQASREAFFPAPCRTHDVVSISSPKTEPSSSLLRGTERMDRVRPRDTHERHFESRSFLQKYRSLCYSLRREGVTL